MQNTSYKQNLIENSISSEHIYFIVLRSFLYWAFHGEAYPHPPFLFDSLAPCIYHVGNSVLMNTNAPLIGIWCMYDTIIKCTTISWIGNSMGKPQNTNIFTYVQTQIYLLYLRFCHTYINTSVCIDIAIKLWASEPIMHKTDNNYIAL